MRPISKRSVSNPEEVPFEYLSGFLSLSLYCSSISAVATVLVHNPNHSTQPQKCANFIKIGLNWWQSVRIPGFYALLVPHKPKFCREGVAGEQVPAPAPSLSPSMATIMNNFKCHRCRRFTRNSIICGQCHQCNYSMQSSPSHPATYSHILAVIPSAIQPNPEPTQ